MTVADRRTAESLADLRVLSHASPTGVLLDRFETLMMNNPVRSFVQRRVEAPLLARMGRGVRGKRVLEVGCGRGVGTQILLDAFGAAEVDALDLDPKMVCRALADAGFRVVADRHMGSWFGWYVADKPT
jgi:2-polyprenyl-3-methyl-5-hydroxy-6-metoxy-1,4-benzoquinol methylase